MELCMPCEIQCKATADTVGLEREKYLREFWWQNFTGAEVSGVL